MDCKIDANKILDLTNLLVSGIINQQAFLDKLVNETVDKRCTCESCLKTTKKTTADYVKEIIQSCPCESCTMRKALSGF